MLQILGVSGAGIHWDLNQKESLGHPVWVRGDCNGVRAEAQGLRRAPMDPTVPKDEAVQLFPSGKAGTGCLRLTQRNQVRGRFPPTIRESRASLLGPVSHVPVISAHTARMEEEFSSRAWGRRFELARY